MQMYIFLVVCNHFYCSVCVRTLSGHMQGRVFAYNERSQPLIANRMQGHWIELHAMIGRECAAHKLLSRISRLNYNLKSPLCVNCINFIPKPTTGGWYQKKKKRGGIGKAK